MSGSVAPQHTPRCRESHKTLTAPAHRRGLSRWRGAACCRFASGGVIDAGTITVEPDGVTVTVEGRSGITNDLQAAVVVREQSVDCSGIADGNKARVYISAELAEHVQVNFTDADTGEALTHTLGVVFGKLQVIEGD